MSGLSMFPARASSTAGSVDALYLFLLAVSITMTLLIFAAVAIFAIKYRRRSDADRPQAIRGSLPLEIFWSATPLLVMMVMFGWGAKLYFQNYGAPPANAAEIYVTGKQWMWKVQHPEGAREINELHVALGRPVKLILASEDVIHSFYIPAFRLKHDVVPGSYQTFWFQPTQTGKFHLFCAEYCGTDHSRMIGWVTVMEPADYQNWLAGGGMSGSMLDRGERMFTQYGCVNCHVLDQKGRCPSLRNVYGNKVTLEGGRTVTADETYLRESILNPNKEIVNGYPKNVMPVFQGQIQEAELLSLIVYIKSLSTGGPQ